MGGRLALVIGSNWGDRPALSYLPEAAHQLAHSLVSPKCGQCEPALPDGRAVVIDPTAHELDEAMRLAFARASDLEATLIVAFTGHGVTVGEDFYLLAADSPADPDSRTAFLAGQRIKELFRRYGRVDGFLLLLDTCESGHAADAAGREWTNVARTIERRFEVLTATGDEPAYGGCFTRTLNYLIRTGSAGALDRLGCAEVHGPINELCTQQRAVHVSVNGAPTRAADVSMWLALNAAESSRRAALDGTAAAGVAAQLIRFYQPTRSFQQVRERIRAGLSVGVIGPAGAGKTALLAALARPDMTPRMHGIWLGEPEHTVEQAATGLAEQLSRTVADFQAAAATYERDTSGEAWLAADAVDRRLLGPLRALHEPVWIVVDNANEQIGRRLVTRLAAHENVRLVCGIREAADLPLGLDPIAVTAATETELIDFGTRRGLASEAIATVVRRSGGNWLTATLLADALDRPTDPGPPEPAPTGLAGFYTAAVERALASTLAAAAQVTAVLAVLAAVGSGPALPGPLLSAACAELDGPSERWQLHEIVRLLTGLVVHGRAADGQELFGLRHPTIAAFLWQRMLGGIRAERVHAVLAAVIRKAVPVDRRPDNSAEAEYAAHAEADHLWRSGQHEEAIVALRVHRSPVHAEDRERWAQWQQRIATDLGADHPLAFQAAAEHARAVAETGDHALALRQLRDLTEDSRAELGARHRVSLSIAQDLAFWTAEDGDANQARRMLTDLVPVITATCGELDPLTLTARHHLALMMAKTGDDPAALDMWAAIVRLRERVIGPTHIDTLRTRHNILYWTAEKAYPPPLPRSSPSWSAHCATRSGSFTPKRSLSAITRRCSWPRESARRTSTTHSVPSPSCCPTPSGSSVSTAAGPAMSASSWPSGRPTPTIDVPTDHRRTNS